MIDNQGLIGGPRECNQNPSLSSIGPGEGIRSRPLERSRLEPDRGQRQMLRCDQIPLEGAQIAPLRNSATPALIMAPKNRCAFTVPPAWDATENVTLMSDVALETAEKVPPITL